MFLFGLIFGLLLAILIFTILAFFRAGVELKMRIIEKKMETAGLKPKGAIFFPEDEATLIRKEIIKKNQEAGLDTPFKDLA